MGATPLPPGQLSEFPFVTSHAVDWADQDAFRHVNHKVFLAWMEENRLAFFSSFDLWQPDINDGIGIILGSVSCNYRRPVNYPDRVHVGIRVIRLGTRSISVQQVIWSAAAAALVADGESTVVVYDYRVGRSAPISEATRTKLSATIPGSCVSEPEALPTS